MIVTKAVSDDRKDNNDALEGRERERNRSDVNKWNKSQRSKYTAGL